MSLQTIPTEELIRPIPPGVIRRFEVPDVDRHGGWMIQRLVKAYPHIHERMVVGILRGMVYMPQFLFLYQDHSVALAEAVRPDNFTPSLTIWERFVWAQDPTNKAHVKQASGFYERFKKWAQQQDAGMLVVGEQSDVPAELITKHVGPVTERKYYCARV